MAIIQSYGLFWRADEVDWHPGQGTGWRLLGRRGSNAGSIQMADFRNQVGIYILYSNLGAYYVGLSLKMGLGKRLKNHMEDKHKGKWERFSWFGFKKLNLQKDENGLRVLRDLPELKPFAPNAIVRDIEALLIKSMSVRNSANMKFKEGVEWKQVELDEIVGYMAKL